MLSLDWIKHCVSEQRNRYSRHADRERQNDVLTLDEVEQAMCNGRIIEEYADTGRGESCLLAGFTDAGKPVHLVCGAMGEWMVIVTLYIPMPPKFKNLYVRGN